jgi:hypothetical protein
MKNRSSDLIILPEGVNGFYDDKDEARKLRQKKILPMFEHGDRVVLDFSHVTYSTQSFVHALLGEVLKRYGDSALDNIEFKHCSPQVKSLIELVVDYSLGGFQIQAGSDVKSLKEEHVHSILMEDSKSEVARKRKSK